MKMHYEGVGRSALINELLRRDEQTVRIREFVEAFDALRSRKHDCGGHVELSISNAEWALLDRLQVEIEELLEAERAAKVEPCRPAAGGRRCDVHALPLYPNGRCAEGRLPA